MKKFMTNKQVIKHLQKQLKGRNVRIETWVQDDIEDFVYTRPWFVEFKLVDGQLICVTAVDE